MNENSVCLFVRVIRYINLFRQIISSISNNSVYHEHRVWLSKSFLFQAFQFAISIVFVHTQLNLKAVRFQTIQFSISTQFSSIWPIDRTLSDITTPGQSWPGSDGNEWYSAFPKTPALLEPPDRIVLCHIQDTSSGGWSYSSAEMPSVYSTAPAEWANKNLIRSTLH